MKKPSFMSEPYMNNWNSLLTFALLIGINSSIETYQVIIIGALYVIGTASAAKSALEWDVVLK